MSVFVLHNFLYLDARLTCTYLSELEGGVYDEEQQSLVDGHERSGGAVARVGPLQGERRRGSIGQTDDEPHNAPDAGERVPPT